MVQQEDSSLLPSKGGVVATSLILGSLDKETLFMEFDVDCGTDLILCSDWLSMKRFGVD